MFWGKQMKDDRGIVKKLESIIDNSFDGIYITDGDANTILVNKSYENITGLKKEDLLHKNMKELVEQQVIDCSGSLMVLNTGEPITLQQEFRTGKRALITSSPIYNDNHEIEMVVTNVRDLTEIYHLKVELNRSNRRQEMLKQEIAHMQQEYLTPNLVAEDARTLETLNLAKRVSSLDTTVMLMGETGVGKEVFAKYIHNESSRKERSFIKINCGAIPENLLESELFGYERGAFTGADRKGKAGLFEVADKGTLFLDEIGELPLSMQVKLLRVLQEQEIKRVGGVKPVKVDVRIIAATNRNLEEMVEQGTFRQDLYYRLMVFPIHIPALRDRVDDIEPLAAVYLSQLNKKYGSKKSFSATAVQVMEDYAWPGNIRELRNVVERAYIISPEAQIQPQSLGILQSENENSALIADKRKRPKKVSDLGAYLAELEKMYIDEAYEEYGNVRDAARSLGMSAATFTRKKNRNETEK